MKIRKGLKWFGIGCSLMLPIVAVTPTLVSCSSDNGGESGTNNNEMQKPITPADPITNSKATTVNEANQYFDNDYLKSYTVDNLASDFLSAINEFVDLKNNIYNECEKNNSWNENEYYEKTEITSNQVFVQKTGNNLYNITLKIKFNQIMKSYSDQDFPSEGVAKGWNTIYGKTDYNMVFNNISLLPLLVRNPNNQNIVDTYIILNGFGQFDGHFESNKPNGESYTLIEYASAIETDQNWNPKKDGQQFVIEHKYNNDPYSKLKNSPNQIFNSVKEAINTLRSSNSNTSDSYINIEFKVIKPVSKELKFDNIK